MNTSHEKSVVLITGASTGIGLALCKLLHRHHQYRIVATARTSSLQRFAAAGLHDDKHLMLYALDVTNPEQQAACIQATEERFGSVDILINNAGVCHRAVFEHLDDHYLEELMRVNFWAPLQLTRLVIPAMRHKRNGSIINVSSVGGMMAMPTMGAYSASKFALEGASEALWYEMRPWNVKVSLIEPGFIHSKAFQNTSFSDQAIDAQLDPYNPYFKYYYYLNKLIAKGMRLAPATPETVAQRIYQVMNTTDPHFRIPATIDAWIFRLLRQILPRGLYHRMLYANIPHVKEFINDSASSSGLHRKPETYQIRI